MTLRILYFKSADSTKRQSATGLVPYYLLIYIKKNDNYNKMKFLMKR